MNAPDPDSRGLATRDFVLLNLLTLFAFSNISVFYGFHAHLEALGVPARWRGLLVGLEPFAALLLRPVLAPLLTPRNATPVLLASLVGVSLALPCYLLARDAPSLALLRLAHGVGFVCLVSSVTTLLVRCIPPGQSARAFGVFTVMTQIPFALMPLLVERLLGPGGDASRAYALVGLGMPPALILGWLLHRRRPAAPDGAAPRDEGARRLSRQEILENLRTPGVGPLLLANLLLFMGTVTVSFYMKDHAARLGLADVGPFFTLSTGMVVFVRLAGAGWLDRLDKRVVTPGLLLGLAGCLAGLALAEGPARLLWLAPMHGLCLGLAMPLLNAGMFLCSAPRCRGLNGNLMLFMMDVGYFASPLLNGLLLTWGAGMPTLFVCAAGFAVLSALVVATAWGALPGPSPRREAETISR